MSDGFFDSIIKICALSSFVLFSLFGMAFAFLSIFRIFVDFLNKIMINSTVNIDCNNKSDSKISKKLKIDKPNKESSKT